MGYFVKKVEKISDFNHFMNGEHSIRNAIDPNSGNNLTRFLNIDLRDKRINLKINNVINLPILFSWTSDISQAPFFYKVISDNEITILKYLEGKFYTDFPYENYPLHFAKCFVDLYVIDPELQMRIMEFNSKSDFDIFELPEKFRDLDKPVHQVLGEAVRQQSDWLDCCSCNNKMDFLVNIGDDTYDGNTYAGNEYVQVVYYVCPSCCIIGCHQECD